MVQAVRPDDRLLGAGVALRVVLARPDALGLWPDRHGPLQTRWFMSPLLGYFNLWFDRQAERYKGVIAWALDHRSRCYAGGRVLRRRPGAAGDGRHPRRAWCRFRTTRCSRSTSRAAGLEPRVRQGEGAGSGPRGAEAAEVAYTYTCVGRTATSVDEGSVFVKLVPKAQRSRTQARSRRRSGRDGDHQRHDCRRSAAG